MRISAWVFAGAGLAAAVGFGGTVLAGKDEIKPCVTFAKTWEGAVADAKAMNLPIVVHSHGWH